MQDRYTFFSTRRVFITKAVIIGFYGLFKYREKSMTDMTTKVAIIRMLHTHFVVSRSTYIICAILMKTHKIICTREINHTKSVITLKTVNKMLQVKECTQTLAVYAL